MSITTCVFIILRLLANVEFLSYLTLWWFQKTFEFDYQLQYVNVLTLTSIRTACLMLIRF
jgi:hypothetical protein